MNKVDKYYKELEALIKDIREKYLAENEAKDNPASEDEVDKKMFQDIEAAIKGEAPNEDKFIPRYVGVAFIKSRKADKKILQQADLMKKAAKKQNIEIITTGIDRSAGLSIDRPAIDELVGIVEDDLSIDVIVVDKLSDLTRDKDDLCAFFHQMAEHGVEICSMQQPGLFPPDCLGYKE